LLQVACYGPEILSYNRPSPSFVEHIRAEPSRKLHPDRDRDHDRADVDYDQSASLHATTAGTAPRMQRKSARFHRPELQLFATSTSYLQGAESETFRTRSSVHHGAAGKLTRRLILWSLQSGHDRYKSPYKFQSSIRTEVRANQWKRWAAAKRELWFKNLLWCIPRRRWRGPVPRCRVELYPGYSITGLD